MIPIANKMALLITISIFKLIDWYFKIDNISLHNLNKAVQTNLMQIVYTSYFILLYLRLSYLTLLYTCKINYIAPTYALSMKLKKSVKSVKSVNRIIDI